MPRKKNPNGPYWTALRAAERKIIWDALALTKGDILNAARLLDIHRNYIRNRINYLGIDVALVREAIADLPVEPVTTQAVVAEPKSWLENL